jgi:hypothetical protein
MRQIPAFSKKSSSGPTVGGGGQRSGFLSHVTSTNAGKPKAAKGMAGFQGKSVAAFSKKKI